MIRPGPGAGARRAGVARGRRRSARGVAPKLAFLVLVGAGVACGLLSVRQQRLQAVGDMAESLRRSAKLDRAILTARLDIAKGLAPDAVRRMAQGVGALRPGVEHPAAASPLYARGTLRSTLRTPSGLQSAEAAR